MGNRSEKIVGMLVYLRPITMADVTERYCAWLNDPEITKYLETNSQTMKQLTRYVRARIDNPNIRFWGIFDTTNDRHIGNIKLEPIDWKEGRTILGIMIGDKNYWSKGISSEMTRSAAEYALRELGLREVRLGILTENIGAWKSYCKAGFVETSRSMAKRWDGSSAEVIHMVFCPQ